MIHNRVQFPSTILQAVLIAHRHAGVYLKIGVADVCMCFFVNRAVSITEK